MGIARKVAHAIKWQTHCIFDAWQDRKLGIDASGLHQKDDLSSSGPNAKHSYVYLGTPHLVLSLILRHLRLDPRRFTFVDLGSGKGRVVLRAATYPFQRVEGVELSPKMHRVAVENVSRARDAGVLCSPVIVHNEDAIAYALPKTPLVLFFFNSFERVVLTQFVDKLRQSLAESPRECYFIYLNPRNGDCLEERSVMHAVPSSRFTRLLVRALSPWPLAVYRASPSASGNVP